MLGPVWFLPFAASPSFPQGWKSRFLNHSFPGSLDGAQAREHHLPITNTHTHSLYPDTPLGFPLELFRGYG